MKKITKDDVLFMAYIITSLLAVGIVVYFITREPKHEPTKEETETVKVEMPAIVMPQPIAYDITSEEARTELLTMGVSIPEDYKLLCEKYGAEYNIAPELLEALIWSESRCQPLAECGICKGLCQININYWLADGEDWRNPVDNIHAGARAIANIITTYECEDLGSIMTRYHGEKEYDAYSGYTEQIARIEYLLERSIEK